jgi:hypothetical protein
MKIHWFKRWGWLYRPVSWEGVVVLVAALSFCVQVFIAVDRNSHSGSDTLYRVFPYFTCCFLLVNWVAGNSSREEA